MTIVRVLLLPLAGFLVAGGAAATEHTISMADTAYVPTALEARVDDTVVFTNNDVANHEVFVPTKGFGIDLGAQKPGTTSRLQLMRPGMFEVECVFHPNMLLKVEVKP